MEQSPRWEHHFSANQIPPIYWKPEGLLPHSQVPDTHPPETGLGAVGNKKVTSNYDPQYQPLDWEASISRRWQQVSWKLRITWSLVLWPEPITRRLLHLVLTFLVQVGYTYFSFTGCIYLRPPSCEEIIFFLLWNFGFLMCVMYTTAFCYEFHFIYAHTDVFLAIGEDIMQHRCVWKCYCTFHSILEVKVSSIYVKRNTSFCYVHHFIRKCVFHCILVVAEK
jgi:hypothetical protein